MKLPEWGHHLTVPRLSHVTAPWWHLSHFLLVLRSDKHVQLLAHLSLIKILPGSQYHHLCTDEETGLQGSTAGKRRGGNHLVLFLLTTLLLFRHQERWCLLLHSYTLSLLGSNKLHRGAPQMGWVRHPSTRTLPVMSGSPPPPYSTDVRPSSKVPCVELHDPVGCSPQHSPSQWWPRQASLLPWTKHCPQCFFLCFSQHL